MKSRSPIILAIIIILLVLGWMFSDNLINNSSSKDDDNNSKIETSSVDNLDEITSDLNISAERVNNKLINKTIRSNSVTYPEFEISITSEVEGNIIKAFVKE